MNRARLVLALVVGLVLVGGCSAPLDSGPKEIREASIPVGLRSETSSTTTTSTPTGTAEEVTVYFINREERLQAVTRQVSAPVTVQKVLETLFAGPTRPEAAAGLRTAINGDTEILSAEVKNQIVTVNTSKYFPFGTLPDQITAFAQVVFTALDLNGVTGVLFAEDGRRLNAFEGTGLPTSVPLGRAAYPQATPR